MNIEAATQKISEMFPNRHVKISECTLVGATCLIVEFANGDSSTAPNRLIENHSAYMRILSSPNGEFVRGKEALNHKQEIERIVSHYKLRDAGLKFRKSSANNADEALDKIVKWFEKNQNLILTCSTR